MFDRTPNVPPIELYQWIFSRRLVYIEVVEAWSNYKKSYL